MNLKEHWENIYRTKTPSEMSWTQETPSSSLDFFRSANLNKQEPIIDIGGGDSKFVDYLLDEDYSDISILDISREALDRAKKRLGKNAEKVHWIESDILDFKPKKKYRFWHDRAAFHFLTQKEDIDQYLSISTQSIPENGYLMIASFSDQGPEKCSGLPVHKYSEVELSQIISNSFEKIECKTENHETPFHKLQNFLFCFFRKK